MSKPPVIYFGPHPHVDQEYERFKRCLPQLVDPESQTGDLTGKWVIFQDGYVYGLSGYDTDAMAHSFAYSMGLGDPHIVALVDLEKHGLHPLHLLSAAIIDQEAEAPDNSKTAGA